MKYLIEIYNMKYYMNKKRVRKKWIFILQKYLGIFFKDKILFKITIFAL